MIWNTTALQVTRMKVNTANVITFPNVRYLIKFLIVVFDFKLVVGEGIEPSCLGFSSPQIRPTPHDCATKFRQTYDKKTTYANLFLLNRLNFFRLLCLPFATFRAMCVTYILMIGYFMTTTMDAC